MSTTILTHVRKDRPSTLEELGDELRRKYKAGSRLDVVQPDPKRMPFAPMMALLTVPPRAESSIVPHELTGETAQLVWWQMDCHLLGVGFAHSQEEAAERALAMADRNNFARRGITVWFDRAWRQFRFFERSRRDPDLRYMPTGREIPASEFVTLAT